jgi:hypothetical protein
MSRLIATSRFTLFICSLALLGPVFSFGQTRNPLTGAWKVIEIAEPDSPAITNPQASLYLFTEKHYSAIRLNGTRQLPSYPSNDLATDVDKVAVFNMLYMNSGAYTISGNTLTTMPEIAKSAFAMAPGRKTEYEFTVKGKMLTLAQKPNGTVLKLVRAE